MSGPALILFAHGARDPEWAKPVEAVATQLRMRFPERIVQVAFLEFLSPTLPDLVARLVEAHADQVARLDILPFFIAQGGHLRKELPELLAAMQQRYPHTVFRLLPPLGELPEVQSAMADAIAGLVNR